MIVTVIAMFWYGVDRNLVTSLMPKQRPWDLADHSSFSFCVVAIVVSAVVVDDCFSDGFFFAASAASFAAFLCCFVLVRLSRRSTSKKLKSVFNLDNNSSLSVSAIVGLLTKHEWLRRWELMQVQTTSPHMENLLRFWTLFSSFPWWPQFCFWHHWVCFSRRLEWPLSGPAGDLFFCSSLQVDHLWCFWWAKSSGCLIMRLPWTTLYLWHMHK